LAPLTGTSPTSRYPPSMIIFSMERLHRIEWDADERRSTQIKLKEYWDTDKHG
jgi:hypothetical protein